MSLDYLDQTFWEDINQLTPITIQYGSMIVKGVVIMRGHELYFYNDSCSTFNRDIIKKIPSYRFAFSTHSSTWVSYIRDSVIKIINIEANPIERIKVDFNIIREKI